MLEAPSHTVRAAPNLGTRYALTTGPVPARIPIRVSYWLALLLFVSLFVEYILNLGETALFLTGAALLLCAGHALFSRFTDGLVLLPYIVVCSPMLRVDVLTGISANVADAYIGLVALCYFLAPRLRSRRTDNRFILCIGAAIGVSWIFSQSREASLFAIIGLCEYLVVFVATRAACRDAPQIQRMMKAWSYAVAVGSGLVVYSYYTNTVLSLSVTEAFRQNVEAFKSGSDFFRATYFLTGFPHLLGVSITSLWTFLLLTRRLMRRSTILPVCALFVNSFALMLCATRSVIASVCFSVVVVTGVVRGWKKMLSVAVAGVVGVSVYVAGAVVVGETQLEALGYRLVGIGSIFPRFAVWGNAWSEVTGSAKVFLFGLGPDISVRRGEDAVLQRIFDSGVGMEGSVDSLYVYILLDYGVVVFALITALVVGVFAPMTKRVFHRKDVDAIVPVWIALVCFGIGAITQTLSVSKFGWAVVQLVAMAAVLTDGDRLPRVPTREAMDFRYVRRAGMHGGSDPHVCGAAPPRLFTPPLG